MSKTNVAITLEQPVLEHFDQIMNEQTFRNHGQATETATMEKSEYLERNRLVLECANLDPAFEKALAEEGLSEDLATWPEY